MVVLTEQPFSQGATMQSDNETPNDAGKDGTVEHDHHVEYMNRVHPEYRKRCSESWERLTDPATVPEHTYGDVYTKIHLLKFGLDESPLAVLWEPLVIATIMRRALAADDPVKELDAIIAGLSHAMAGRIRRYIIPAILDHELPDAVYQLLDKAKAESCQAAKD
jgi:hypothetical protein